MEKELSIEFTRHPYIIRIKYDGELLKELYYENVLDFLGALHLLEDKNDREIYDWCKGWCIFTNYRFNGKEVK